MSLQLAATLRTALTHSLTIMLPINSPPLDPPRMPSLAGDVTCRRIKSSATAMKSS